ncbi:tRNA pseudouridine(55) synthase TruB [Campylobacter geochelonis]|uniref:tRNA pseudouridine synthase B n=1 Tax=Campylobacter geochelonis TaxID=1780362 RepID=A0A128ENA6_9BACT|nr:tRNA pseudouridine(55) synthase TruB [Campylobacter geochelonis]QKF70961.1 tRNA pseudouridine 55 synthase [Campylobacter geochelonis]CZE47046.1 tRNA pseudouridine synthase B [Campylobacter geochelonis]CZE47533.1 tRNA pseudouridine synthase B [Campylobacter geochelonis]CZE50223.1 tRNA pseudouridine synthase B [Campylobacter geochelonis]
MNRLFVANKPMGVGSNHFLSKLKRKYGVKKAGFSGTLDPFASGCLIVAFGEFTRFFRFLKKTPKIYQATIWIGASSPSGDNENIKSVEKLLAFHSSAIELIAKSLVGELEYIPPKFSAKRVDGKRAYELARKGDEFELKKSVMSVYSCEIISYMHPFLSLRLSVSEGAYIRSYAELFAKKLGVNATLSALKRVSEGEFKFEDEKALNPLEYLNLAPNLYLGNFDDVRLGKKLNLVDFKNQNDGEYLLNLDDLHSIIKIENGNVSYLLNRIKI